MRLIIPRLTPERAANWFKLRLAFDRNVLSRIPIVLSNSFWPIEFSQMIFGSHCPVEAPEDSQAFREISSTNRSDDITGAKKLLIRSMAAASCSGF
jgi:hypothetical protein